MRTMFALVFFVLAAWRVYIDWQSSAAQGQEFVMATTQNVWQALSPASLEGIVAWTRGLDKFPEVWDPGLVTFLSLPMAPVLLVTALFFFLIRRKPEPVRRGEMA